MVLVAEFIMIQTSRLSPLVILKHQDLWLQAAQEWTNWQKNLISAAKHVSIDRLALVSVCGNIDQQQDYK